MDVSFLIRGLLIGLAIAAPVGAIGLLCIRRTLAEGRLTGFISGLGAATADAFYGAAAAFGFGPLTAVLIDHQTMIRLLGGVFLVYLGIRTAVAIPALPASAPERRGLVGAYASTVMLTLANPSTILSFLAVFAGLGLAGVAGDRLTALSLVIGVFLGSSAWWLVLSGATGLFRRAMTPARLRWVNLASGVILAGFGLVAIASIFS